MSQPTPADDEYDLAPQPEPQRRRQTVLKPLVPGEPVPLNYRAPGLAKGPPAETETIKNVYMPAALIGGSLVVELALQLVWPARAGVGPAEFAAELLVGTPLMCVAVVLASRFRGFDLGSKRTVLLRLAAVAVAPSAVADLISPWLGVVPLGFLLTLGVQFVLCFALLGAMFDLDESDTWFCLWTIVLCRLAFVVAMMLLKR